MKKISTFESFLFIFTRLFSVFGSIIALVGMLYLFVALLSSGKDTYVSYDEVIKEITPTQTSSNDTSTDTSKSDRDKINMPENLKTYFTDDNERVLQKWLEDYNENQKNDFLKNLSQLVKIAEEDQDEKGPEIITNVINTYKDIKFQKLSEDEIEEYINQGIKAGYLLGILGLAVFLALLSLVLVLLAIERNTRSAYEAKQ